MKSEDYWDGFHGRPKKYGADTNDYNEGESDSNGGMGGVGVAMILLLIAVPLIGLLVLALATGVCALQSGTALYIFARKVKSTPISFRKAYMSAYWVTLVFIILESSVVYVHDKLYLEATGGAGFDYIFSVILSLTPVPGKLIEMFAFEEDWFT